MIDWAISHVPVKYRVDGFLWFLTAVFAFASGFATNLLYREHVVTQVRVTHPSVAQVLGKPDQTVAGAAVNQALAGETCGVYQAKRVVYCHP